MRSLLIGVTFISLLFISCSKDNHTFHNPNLLDVNVNFTVNTSLPQFSVLQFPMQPVYVAGYGNGGVIIMKISPGNYRAFDAADPNHPVENCSTLAIHEGSLNAECQCADHNTYSLVTGLAIPDKSGGKHLKYTLRPYQVIVNGNGTLTISN